MLVSGSRWAAVGAPIYGAISMVKPIRGKGGSRKETIKPPTKKELTDASKQLRKGHPSGGRTLADKSVAVRQRVTKPSKKK